MAETYSFDEQTQVKLLSLLRQNYIGPEHIQPSYFINPILSEFCQALITLQKINNPTPQMIFHEVKQGLGDAVREYLPDIKKYMKFLFKNIEESHVLHYIDLASEFAEYIMYRRAVQESIELLRKNNPRSVRQLKQKWEKVVNIDLSINQDTSVDYFSTIAERIKRRLETPDVLKTLIPELDARLSNGGIARGEIFLFIGSTGTGKSLALQHIAKAAVLQQKNVIFFTLEMKYDRVEDRFDSAFTNIPMNDLRNQSEEVSRRMEKLAKQFDKRLRLQFYPAYTAKVSTLKRCIEQFDRNGFVADLIIVDSINLLVPEYKTNVRHEDLGQTYLDLRSLLQQLNVFNATAAQGNRGSTKTELLTVGDVAQSYEGTMHSDIIATLNRTEQEKQQQRLRLYLAKNRNDVDSVILSLYTNFASGQFYRRRIK